MPEPIFNEGDRVPPDKLPPELEGKSPLEIAQFYQGREREIIENARTLITKAAAGSHSEPPPVAPPPPKVTITKEEWWNDPQKAAEKLLSDRGVTKETFDRLAGSAQATIIAMAEKLASDGKADWPRFASQIKAVMSRMDAPSQTDPEQWNTAYFAIRGQNTDALIREAKEETRKVLTEPVNAPPDTPAAPRDLNPLEEKVISGLDISADMYRQGEKRMNEGIWPMTTDNRRK